VSDSNQDDSQERNVQQAHQLIHLDQAVYSARGPEKLALVNYIIQVTIKTTESS
jgi:hypothetical protein